MLYNKQCLFTNRTLRRKNNKDNVKVRSENKAEITES